MANRVYIDCETRSLLSLKEVGAWVYSRHPSTEVMCLAWSFGDEEGLWHMAHPYRIAKLRELLAKTEEQILKAKREEVVLQKLEVARQIERDIEDLQETPPPLRLFELVRGGAEVEAHNVFFERCVWTNILSPRLGWPQVRDSQWRCSAAKASMHSIPRDLERATLEMCPDRAKDVLGRKTMLKLTRPAGPTKTEPDRVWHEDPEDLRVLWDYCRQDVRAERALSEALEDLPESELRTWQMDQRMNLRGIRCDTRLASRALQLRDELLALLDREVAELTRGGVTSVKDKRGVLAWLAANGVPGDELIGASGKGDSLAKEAIARAKIRLAGTAAPDALRMLDIVGAANKSSIAKYEAMLRRADPVDHRLRDLVMYHGASTGRWAGKGVQIHNFPRGGIKLMDVVCAALLDDELSYMLEAYWTPVELMGVLSDALRGALTASEGRVLYVADYTAIEARVVFWLADCMPALAVFRAGKDIYRDMASAIYKMAYEAILKDSEHRRMGKQAILGLGYQMGAPKFWDTIAGYEPAYKGVDSGGSFEIPMESSDEMLRRIRSLGDEGLNDKLKYGNVFDDAEKRRILTFEYNQRGLDARRLMAYFLFVREVVVTYREKYPEVKAMWDAQNWAAIEAVRTGKRVAEGKMVWHVRDGFLRCTLPSGRDLFYRRPEIRRNKFGKDALFYWAVDSVTHQWRLTGTYGGKIVENVTQAVARDIMAHGMANIDAHPVYDLLGSVHDEGIAEADEGAGDLDEFLGLITAREEWARDVPVEAEGWTGFRYRK